MQPTSSSSQAGTPLAELILSESQRSLGRVQLETVPQPGSAIAHGGTWYMVLERRHRYQFQANRYRLTRITLYVQVAPQAEDKRWLGDRWVIGDASCRYNACSPCCAALWPPQAPAKAVATTSTATLRALQRPFFHPECSRP